MPRLLTPAFPVVISGPSGAGKTVLCERLVSRLPWTALSVSATTRSPRPGERDGEAYFFYSRETFEAEIDGGGFVEWAEVHGCLYGTPRAYLEEKLRQGICVVMNIDVQGGLQLRRAVESALLIFVLPPSLEVLERRLERRRTDRPEEIQRRLETARREIEVLPDYDFVVVNDDLNQAVDELAAIVSAERARIWRRCGKRSPGTVSA